MIGIDVTSAWRKFSESSMALPTLASPASLMVRLGCPACTAATAFWSAATAWSLLPLWLGTWNRTSALRPSADTREVLPAVNGDRMVSASRGSAANAATTWRAACCISWLRGKVAAPGRPWTSTDSESWFKVAGATWCSACSPWPAWPGS